MRAGASAAAPGPSKRAVVLLPGLGNNSQDYKDMGVALEQRGLHVQTAAVTRIDWLRNAAGLRQMEYWRGILQPRPVVDWCADISPEALQCSFLQRDGIDASILETASRQSCVDQPHRYLERVDVAVAAAKQATDGPITLLAHSAGGWLARVYLLVRDIMCSYSQHLYVLDFDEHIEEIF